MYKIFKIKKFWAVVLDNRIVGTRIATAGAATFAAWNHHQRHRKNEVFRTDMLDTEHTATLAMTLSR